MGLIQLQLFEPYSLSSHGLQHIRLSFTVSWSVFKLMSIESVMPSDYLILCCPLLFLPSIFPSIRLFSNESVLPIRLSKYWSFSFHMSPSYEYSGLIAFRFGSIDVVYLCFHCRLIRVYLQSMCFLLQSFLYLCIYN